MVGLVIVSHSAQLAEGVAELVRGMAGPDVRIATAGGMDLPDRPLGTDANLIARAIRQVYSDEGVVVLADLGSAILATEMAIETFPPEQRAHIALAPAALVEGGIAAAVQARLGSPLDAVVSEARSALDAKLAHLGAAQPPAASPAPTTAPGASAQRLRLQVKNRLGLHARPAARLVQTAAKFQSQVTLTNVTAARGPVNAKSINAVTTLGISQGNEIEIAAVGPDAAAALRALKRLADENFGDLSDLGSEQALPSRRAESAPQGEAGANEIVGLAASPGYAVGPARLYRRTLPPVPQDRSQDPAREWARLQQAIREAQAQLRATRAALNGKSTLSEAEIFDAQVLMLEDEMLQEPARRAIFERQENAAAAFDHAANVVIAQYQALRDEYLRARAADVRAVARLVLVNLLGGSHTPIHERGILVASDLTPAETAVLDPAMVQALCTAYGAPTGHSAILAKSLGIPAVVGLGERLFEVQENDTLIVDGERGRVWLDPDPELVARYETKLGQADAKAQTALAKRHEAAVTRDGHRVEIAANIGSLKDAREAVAMGAEAVGLFRTEFLFLDRADAPGEDEQYETYRAMAEALGGRSLVIRTLDVGGDKPLPYVHVAREANPFLGLRGLRLSLAQPNLFLTQLRAIWRVADEFPLLRVMFPMVTAVHEFRAAVELMNRARAELAERGESVPARIETGIMVEVPSAALSADAFAREVDFFSLGTNDLIQYTLAAERGNPAVAALAEMPHPAVLQLVSMVVHAAHARNKWVGVCGEMGGDPKAIPLLVGLGVDELSMSPPLIPAAKEIVRGLTLTQAQAEAQRAMGQGEFT